MFMTGDDIDDLDAVKFRYEVCFNLLLWQVLLSLFLRVGFVTLMDRFQFGTDLLISGRSNIIDVSI